MTERPDQPRAEGARDDDELRALLRRVRQVEIRAKRSVNAHAMGAYHSRFKGRGMAFEESRQYVPGDDPRHIDWNVTARTDELHVKQFIEERELTLILAVDVSASMSFGTRGQRKRQLAAEAAALLAFSAMRNNDKVGLLLFSDRIERLIRPRKGRGHALRMLREILAHKPEGTATDHARMLETATHLSRQKAIVCWITDLFPDEQSAGGLTGEQAAKLGQTLGAMEKPLKVLARRHELITIEVSDPLELTVPDVGLLAVRDPETGKQALIDTSKAATRKLYADRMRAERAAVRGRLGRLGVEHLTLTCGEDGSRALVRFLQRRAKRAA